MNTKKISILLIAFTLVFTVLESCKGKLKGNEGTLNVHEAADPDKLNPITCSNIAARNINELIFSQVVGAEVTGNFDYKPILTKELAKISEITEGEFKGGMKLEYEFKEDAVWDNGTPITGYDYAFTIKIFLNPKTNGERLKSYYDWVGDILIDSANPKKITILSNRKYFKIEEFSGYYILPEYNYDPNKIMRKFKITDLNTSAKRDALKTNPDILTFANEFNSEKFQRDPKFISGMGPYKLDHWTTGQEIVLVKKKNWWGDKYASVSRDFIAYPSKIKVKIINDNNTALTTLKDGQLDAYPIIPAKDFSELEKNKSVTDKFNLVKEDRFAYSFLGMNLRNDKFKDLRVRKAIKYAIDKDKINKVLYNNEFKKTETFVHPVQSAYNKNLKPNGCDIVQSNKLLDEAGWKDTDGDGIRDKVINGRKTPFNVDLKFPKNEINKNLCLILQEDFKKIGINLNIMEKEFTVLIQEQDKLQFEMYLGGFSIPERITDPKQLWHTANTKPGGDNKSGWGNAHSDALIDNLNAELNPEVRKKYYMELQELIYNDIPVIFLFNPINRIAISKKYEVETLMSTPGYKIQEFKLK